MSEIISLQAQLDAAKQMYNDSSNIILQLRTNLNLINNNLNEANQKIAVYEKEIEDLKNQNAPIPPGMPSYVDI
jgi:capsule polysaccharide export protein KpsE/RkpR